MESKSTFMPAKRTDLDNYKVFLTFIVILHHAAIAYGGAGGWPVRDPSADAVSRFLLPLFNAVNQSYFMAAFFFLSGRFTPASYERKGALGFLKDRLIRFGIPLLIYSLVVTNFNRWMIARVEGNADSFVWSFVFRAGHLWYVEALLVFSLMYVALRKLPLRNFLNGVISPFASGRPSLRVWLLLIAGLSMLTFAVRIAFPVGRTVLSLQLGHFVHYVFAFFAGTIIGQSKRFEIFVEENARVWRRSAWVTLPGLLFIGLFGGALSEPAVFNRAVIGGATWPSAAYCVWESVLLIALNIAFLELFATRFKKPGQLQSVLAANAYTVYLVHQTVLLFANAALLPVPIPTVLKLLASAIFAVMMSLALSMGLRRLPRAKAVLG